MSCNNTVIPFINSTGWYILSNNEESSIYNTVTKYIDIADLSFVNYYSIIYYTNKDGSGGWPSSVTLNPAVDYCNITEILGDNTQIKPNLAYWIYVEDFQYFGQPETPGIALTYDISSAFSIYVNSYEDNIDANGIQGPSYICFDPSGMSDASSVITYTATANIHVSGFLIGYGGPGGAYIWGGPGFDTTRGGGGGGGNGGVDISFNMNQGDTFTCQFKGGTPNEPGTPTGWFSGAKTILTTSDTSYNLEQGGAGLNGNGRDAASGGQGKNGGGTGSRSDNLNGRGGSSNGVQVNGMIKTQEKANGTPIFSGNDVTPVVVGASMRFGSGGGGGLDSKFGGPAQYQLGGRTPYSDNRWQPYTWIRNYGAAGGGGQSGPASPKYGANPGYAGLILTTFKRTNQSFLLNYDISSAFSTFINTDYEFNAGGPSYAIFDPSQMSDASSVITFTAQQDIRISGFLIGYGGCGGSGGRTYADTNYVKISGGGGGGNGGTAISFDMNQGETFRLQFRKGGTPIADNLNSGLNFENATTILTTSDTSYNLTQGGRGSNINLYNGTYRPDGGLGTNGGGNGGDGSVDVVYPFPSPGTDSSGVIVSSIIKAAQRVNGTVLFSNSYSNPTTIPYVPPRFGAGGGGGAQDTRAFANAGVFDIGGGDGNPNDEASKNANLYLRNYGAGGAGGRSSEGSGGIARFGGTGGIPGLIISTSPI